MHTILNTFANKNHASYRQLIGVISYHDFVHTNYVSVVPLWWIQFCARKQYAQHAVDASTQTHMTDRMLSLSVCICCVQCTQSTSYAPERCRYVLWGVSNISTTCEIDVRSNLRLHSYCKPSTFLAPPRATWSRPLAFRSSPKACASWHESI